VGGGTEGKTESQRKKVLYKRKRSENGPVLRQFRTVKTQRGKIQKKEKPPLQAKGKGKGTFFFAID